MRGFAYDKATFFKVERIIEDKIVFFLGYKEDKFARFHQIQAFLIPINWITNLCEQRHYSGLGLDHSNHFNLSFYFGTIAHQAS